MTRPGQGQRQGQGQGPEPAEAARAAAIAQRAAQALGTPFRLHGRNPGVALDCIGLAGFALFGEAGMQRLPRDYRLRGHDGARLTQALGDFGLRSLCGGDHPQTGDVLLLRPGPAQWHLAIVGDGGILHAHAGLGRVAAAALPAPEEIHSVWRLPKGDE